MAKSFRPLPALAIAAASLSLLGLAACSQSAAKAGAEGNAIGNSVMAGEGEAAKGPATALSSLSKDQQDAVRALVRDTLVANPEILLEAQRAYEAKQNREMNERVAASFDKLKREEASLSFGPANAPITVVEFFDYKCGFCHLAQPWVVSLLEERKDVRIIFKELPILSDNSRLAAKAAIAAHRQGKYLEFHNALMTARGDLNTDQVNQIAASVGIDVERMRKDMDDPKVDQQIEAVRTQATELGINGTPAFVINGKLVSGFAKEELEAALGGAGVDAPAAKRG